jgi:hypothetical protein
VVHLSSKLIVSFSPGDVEGLEGARSPRGLSGLQDVDGVQIGSNWRPVEQQGQKGRFQSKWKTWRPA